MTRFVGTMNNPHVLLQPHPDSCFVITFVVSAVVNLPRRHHFLLSLNRNSISTILREDLLLIRNRGENRAGELSLRGGGEGMLVHGELSLHARGGGGGGRHGQLCLHAGQDGELSLHRMHPPMLGIHMTFSAVGGCKPSITM